MTPNDHDLTWLIDYAIRCAAGVQSCRLAAQAEPHNATVWLGAGDHLRRVATEHLGKWLLASGHLRGVQ